LDDYKSVELTKVMDYPEDDVYLTYRHKPKHCTLMEAIELLKDYTVLDLTDQSSFVILKVKLVPFSVGKGKRVSK